MTTTRPHSPLCSYPRGDCECSRRYDTLRAAYARYRDEADHFGMGPARFRASVQFHMNRRGLPTLDDDAVALAYVECAKKAAGCAMVAAKAASNVLDVAAERRGW